MSTRTVTINAADLAELVHAASEPIRIRGTHASHRALAQAQLALDTMLPDADGLLGWTRAAQAIRTTAVVDANLSPAKATVIGAIQADLRAQLDRWDCDPHDYRTGLGALAVLFTAARVATSQHTAGEIDHATFTATTRVLSHTGLATTRFAPAEVRR